MEFTNFEGNDYQVIRKDNKIILVPYDKEKMKYEWVRKWYHAFVDEADTLNVDCTRFGSTRIVYNKKGAAVARLRPGDKYQDEVGLAVAYARLMGEPIPDYI